MKKKLLVTEIVKTAINCIIVPLYFIKFFHEVALFPNYDEEGNLIVNRRDYYLSVYGEMCRAGIEFIFWLAFSVCIASVILSLTRFFVKDNKALKIASHIVFAISLVFFLALLFLMLQIDYKY